MAPRAALRELEEGGEVEEGEEVVEVGESGAQGVEAGAVAVAVVAALIAAEAAASLLIPQWTTLLVLTRTPLIPNLLLKLTPKKELHPSNRSNPLVLRGGT